MGVESLWTLFYVLEEYMLDIVGKSDFNHRFV